MEIRFRDPREPTMAQPRGWELKVSRVLLLKGEQLFIVLEALGVHPLPPFHPRLFLQGMAALAVIGHPERDLA